MEMNMSMQSSFDEIKAMLFNKNSRENISKHVEYEGDSINYDVFTYSETWENARLNCNELDADLISIDSQEEFDYIYKLISSTSRLGVEYCTGIWTSGNNDNDDGVWVWGDSDELVTYVWAEWEPSSVCEEGGCCTAMNNYYDNTLYADACQAKKCHICEKSP